MPKRRTLLSRIATIAIGGSFAGAPTAASQSSGDDTRQSTQRDSTELSVWGNPAVFQQTEIPTVAIPYHDVIGRYAGIVPMGDIDRFVGMVETRDGRLGGGSATALGSFRVDVIAAELQRYTRFSRISSDHEPNSDGRASASRSSVTQGGAQADQHRKGDDSPSEILTRSNPASIIGLEPGRIDVSVDAGRAAVLERFARRRRRTGGVGEPNRVNPEQAAGNGSDLVAHVTLGEVLRSQIRTHLSPSADHVDRFIGSIDEVWIAVEAGPDTTEVRYTFSRRDGGRPTDDFTGLLAAVRAHNKIRLVDSSIAPSTVSAHVSIRTDSVWTAHTNLLGF